MAGLTTFAGEADRPPAWMGFAMSDIFSGTCAFAGTLIALRDRDRTGRGTRVDIGMFDAALLMNDLPMAYQMMVGETMGRGQYALQSPWGPFVAKDGYVIIAVLNLREWQALCAAIERDQPTTPTWPPACAQRTRKCPSGHQPDQPRSRAEIVDTFPRRGPTAPVNTAADLVNDPQVGPEDVAAHAAVSWARYTIGNPNVGSSPVMLATLPAREDTDDIPRSGSVDDAELDKLR